MAGQKIIVVLILCTCGFTTKSTRWFAKGAAIGAASGGMLGAMRRRSSQKQQDQMNQQVQ